MTALVLGLSLWVAAGGTDPGTLTVPFGDGQSCAGCHVSTDPRLASSSYKATMMSLASVDPIFLAALHIANQDDAATSALCIRCHFPAGWLFGRGGTDGTGLQQADKQGIGCLICHRMVVPPALADGGVSDAGLADAGAASRLGGLLLDNAQIFFADDDIMRGPFADAVFTPEHDSLASPLFSDSALCGQCHEVTNTSIERVDPDTGLGLGVPVPEQRTYTEWARSAFAGPDGKTCQDCHMEAFEGVMVEGNAPTRALRAHSIVGGNTIGARMVAALPAQSLPPFLQNLSADAERVADATIAFLQQESATLQALRADVNPGASRFTVRVTNLAGHKLPTGYAEGRRMWIAHTVTYADGRAGPSSGQPDSTTWDFDPQSAPPARIWEIVLGNPAGEKTFRFLTADRILKDNRIPPRGFRPTDDTAPVGHVFADLGDGVLAHYDDVTLPLGEVSCWPAIVKVDVLFQTSSGEYFRYLRDNGGPAGITLGEVWDQVGGARDGGPAVDAGGSRDDVGGGGSDAGGADDPVVDGGCTCSAGGARALAQTWLCALALVVWRRRAGARGRASREGRPRPRSPVRG